MSEINVVNKLTLANAIVGLVKSTGNFNHFLATPQGTTAMVDHLNDTRKWWPDYSTYFTDARIRILLAVYVAKKYYPELADEYKDKLGSQRVAGDVFKSCLARMGADVTDEDAIPPNVKDVWNTQDYWDKACKFADTVQNKRNEAYNLEVERKKNPGHFKVAGKWVPYGSVFTDAQGQEMVVINHTALPLALVESRGQGFENSLAVMPLEKAQPAINRINELGGNMFAAICRVGFAEIEQLVAECGELDIKQLGMRRDHLAEPVLTGAFAPLSRDVSLDDLTDEQIAGIKPGWSVLEGKTQRESWAHYAERGGRLQWAITAFDQATKDRILAGEVDIASLPGAQVVVVLPKDFYDGCTKVDYETGRASDGIGAKPSKPTDPCWLKEQQLQHYVDLGFTAGEALDLHLRGKLMRELNRLFKGADLDLAGIAEMTGFTIPVAREWQQGHVELWSLEELTELDEKVRKAFQEINEQKQKGE